MNDWYFDIKMQDLDNALLPFKHNNMTLKQWDTFHKKMHYTLNKTPQPQL